MPRDICHPGANRRGRQGKKCAKSRSQPLWKFSIPLLYKIAIILAKSDAMHLLYFLFLFLAACSNSERPAPYNELKEVLPYDRHGWYSNSKELKQLISDHRVRTVVEVGCWLGKSTRHIAKQLPRNGKIYAVDHWQGSAEHQPGACLYWQGLDQLYQQFLSNIIHAKLTHKVIPIRMASVDAEKFLKDLKPDLIYLDASHDMESVYQDLTVWYPHIKGHGILCGDDWGWPGVQEAVKKFAEENQLKIKAKDAFWQLL
jgi:hypothetical protein